MHQLMFRQYFFDNLAVADVFLTCSSKLDGNNSLKIGNQCNVVVFVVSQGRA